MIHFNNTKVCVKVLLARPHKAKKITPKKLPESALVAILGTLVHVLTVAEGSRRKPVGARALEAAVQVGAGAVAADARPLHALVFVHALLAGAVQAIATRAFTSGLIESC